MSDYNFKMRYIPEFDGLRGVAILGVILFHAGAPFLKGGFIGVDIFFVLSGFLITSFLIKEFDKYDSINIKNFYVRRILRLIPALLFLLITYCFISFLLLSGEAAKKNYIDALISFFYLSNWARAFSIHPPDFLGHTWSLSIEEQFYMIWPIILLTMLRFRIKRHYIAIITSSIALLAWMLRIYLSVNSASAERIYNGLDTRADALMIGCTIGIAIYSGLINENAKKTIEKLLISLCPISIFCLSMLSIVARWDSPWMSYLGFTIVEIMSSILVFDILINEQSVIRKFLLNVGFVWIGKISYSLYLWHYPIYRTMKAMKYDGFTTFIVGTILTFIMSMFSYYVIEKPILKFKTSFSHSHNK